jgi:hypothetical protein
MKRFSVALCCTLFFGLLPLGGGCGDSNKSDPVEVDAAVPPDAAPLITREEVLHACLRTDGCGVMPYGYLSHCVTSHYDESFVNQQMRIWSHLYRCVNAAGGDCPSIRACFSEGSQPEPCSEMGDGYCDGDVRVYCDIMDRKLYRFDCSLSSLQCAVGEASGGVLTPYCAYGPCNPNDYAPKCEGDWLLTCDDGYIDVWDCSAQGLGCGQKVTTPSMGCIGRGPECDPAYTPTCEGDVLTKCVEGHLAVIDCRDLPGRLTCSADNGGECVQAGTQCTGSVEECQGTVARVCLDGYWVTVDCVDLGFRECVVENSAGVHCRL